MGRASRLRAERRETKRRLTLLQELQRGFGIPGDLRFGAETPGEWVRRIDAARQRRPHNGQPCGRKPGEFTAALLAGLAEHAWLRGAKQREHRRAQREAARAAVAAAHLAAEA